MYFRKRPKVFGSKSGMSIDEERSLIFGKAGMTVLKIVFVVDRISLWPKNEYPWTLIVKSDFLAALINFFRFLSSDRTVILQLSEK